MLSSEETVFQRSRRLGREQKREVRRRQREDQRIRWYIWRRVFYAAAIIILLILIFL